MKRLNMWQRLGVVASILWMLGAGAYTMNRRNNEAVASATSNIEGCNRDAFEVEGTTKVCREAWQDFYTAYSDGKWNEAATTAFGPVILGWLVAFIAVITTRWVRAGRKPGKEPA